MAYTTNPPIPATTTANPNPKHAQGGGTGTGTGTLVPTYVQHAAIPPPQQHQVQPQQQQQQHHVQPQQPQQFQQQPQQQFHHQQQQQQQQQHYFQPQNLHLQSHHPITPASPHSQQQTLAQQHQHSPQKAQTQIRPTHQEHQQTGSGAGSPGAGPGRAQGWNTGLFDCFDDWNILCWGYLLPCVLHSRTHHRLRVHPSSTQGFSRCNSSCWLWSCCGNIGIGYRQRNEIRHRYNLAGSECGDFCAQYWCTGCALCQEEREVKFRELQKSEVGQQGVGYQSIGGSGGGMVYARQ